MSDPNGMNLAQLAEERKQREEEKKRREEEQKRQEAG